MTKKDYIYIADALIRARVLAKELDLNRDKLPSHGVTAAQVELEKALYADNPKFDSVRFREYIAAKLYA